MEPEIHPNRQRPTRREFAKILMSGAAAVTVLYSFKFAFEYLGKARSEFRSDVDYKALNRLFGIGDSKSAALVPAADHPFEPPPDNFIGYPIDYHCCGTYATMISLASNVPVRAVNGEPKITRDDSVVLFGSQISNKLTRDILGNPDRDEPKLKITHKERWATTLWWNLFSPKGTGDYVAQEYGKPWREENFIIGGNAGETYQVRSQHPVAEDFLLVTSLPRFSSDSRRIRIFAGAHGAGQMATNLLLASPSDSLLKKLEEKTERQPYYQALFHVVVKRDQNGDVYADAIDDLIDAKPLDVTFL